jgi:hypothetical protein
LNVCSSVRRQPLEPDLPAGAAIVILKNDGGIMNNDLVIQPLSMNVTKTTVFNVSYAINGKQTDTAITVVFANADFTMELKTAVVGNTQITSLILTSLDPTITKSDWLVKQGNNVIEKTDKVLTISIEDNHLSLSRLMDITHSVEAGAAEGCAQKKTFRLTKAVVDRKINQEPFNNDFVIG